MSEIEIKSILDLLRMLSENKFPVRWFRGHSELDWELLPGFYRAIPTPMSEAEVLKRF